jgi:hypothetical protein
MKMNIDSAMKPDPDFPASQRRWTSRWQVTSPIKGGLLASLEILRAHDKTWGKAISSALAQKACRDGYSAFYTRAAALFRDLALA